MINNWKNIKYLLKSYYWEKVTYLKFRFSRFKKFVFTSVFGELQFSQISLNFQTSPCNLKIWEQNCVWLRYYFKNLCPLFFVKFLFFYQMIALPKPWKMFFFHLKSSFRSRDIKVFVFFPLPSHTFQIQKDKSKWNNLWCHKSTCINLQM